MSEPRVFVMVTADIGGHQEFKVEVSPMLLGRAGSRETNLGLALDQAMNFFREHQRFYEILQRKR